MNKVKKAVEILADALKNNPGYYESWKANIAVQFQDEYRRCGHRRIHEISNKAADNFLKLLIND